MSKGRIVEVDPPGKIIKQELDARGWSQRDLAFILGQTEQQLNPLLSGKRAISPDMARLLADAFSVPAQFFADLQSQYDLSRAREPDPGVKTRAMLQDALPVRDMIRRGWLEDAEGSLLKLQVDRFLETANDNSQTVAFAAKRTHYDNTSTTQLAWVYRVRQLARTIAVEPFSPERLRATLPSLRALMIHPAGVSEAIPILNAAGVRIVIVEALPGAKIDGVCTWLNADSPVIGLSTLYDRFDNFWFVLRHEIEHVLHGHGMIGIGKIDSLSTDEVENTTDDEEIIANTAAADFCISSQKMDSFYSRKYPYFSEKDVIGFAATNGVHPAIVVGQLQRRLKRYDYLRKYQVPVRKYLLDSAPVDGWGAIADIPL